MSGVPLQPGFEFGGSEDVVTPQRHLATIPEAPAVPTNLTQEYMGIYQAFTEVQKGSDPTAYDLPEGSLPLGEEEILFQTAIVDASLGLNVVDIAGIPNSQVLSFVRYRCIRGGTDLLVAGFGSKGGDWIMKEAYKDDPRLISAVFGAVIEAVESESRSDMHGFRNLSNIVVSSYESELMRDYFSKRGIQYRLQGRKQRPNADSRIASKNRIDNEPQIERFILPYQALVDLFTGE